MNEKEALRAINALRRGQPLAAELSAADPDFYTYVGVYPIRPDTRDGARLIEQSGVRSIAENEKFYRVRIFRVRKEPVDKDECISEEEIDNLLDRLVFNEDDIELIGKEYGFDFSNLKAPFRSGYPI